MINYILKSDFNYTTTTLDTKLATYQPISGMTNYVLNSNMVYYLTISSAESTYLKKLDYIIYYNDL